MTRLSAVVGKPVLNIASTCITGKVEDVYFDAYLKKAVYFCIDTAQDKTAPDTNGNINMKLLLPFEAAQNISDAVVIPDVSALISATDADTSELKKGFLDKPVYTSNGVSKGIISDVIISSAGKVTKIVTVSDEFAPSSVLAVGEVILQKNVAKTKQRKSVIPRPEKDYPVYILNDTEKVLSIEKAILNANKTGGTPLINATVNAATLDMANYSAKDIAADIAAPDKTGYSAKTSAPDKADYPTKDSAAIPAKRSTEPVLTSGAFEVLLDGSQAYSYEEDSHTPTRVICDYEFLLGRTLGADLCTYTGELIAKQGTDVTDAVVEKARRAGKLVELTLNSIKPSNKN